MSADGDDGPSGSVAEPAAEAGGIGGRGSSKKAMAKYSERSTNSRSLEDTDSVVDEEQPALGAITLFLHVCPSTGIVKHTLYAYMYRNILNIYNYNCFIATI